MKGVSAILIMRYGLLVDPCCHNQGDCVHFMYPYNYTPYLNCFHSSNYTHFPDLDQDRWRLYQEDLTELKKQLLEQMKPQEDMFGRKDKTAKQLGFKIPEEELPEDVSYKLAISRKFSFSKPAPTLVRFIPSKGWVDKYDDSCEVFAYAHLDADVDAMLDIVKKQLKEGA